MKGDFNQWLVENAKRQSYVSLLQQQGRPVSAADLAAQTQLGAGRVETALADVIGPAGTPKGLEGFRISLSDDGELQIGAGSYYVDGLRVDNPQDVPIRHQIAAMTDIPGSEATEPGEPLLVYLEVWRDTVSASEDNLLLDPSLDGRDTSVAEKPRWLVGVMPMTATDTSESALLDMARTGRIIDFKDLRSTGTLRAQALPQAPSDENDCLIAPDAGYLSLEDHLYRVEIVEGGDEGSARFAWSRVNGAVVSALAAGPDGLAYLEPELLNHELGFSAGDTIEVSTALDRYLGRAGTFGSLTSSDGAIAPALLKSPQNPTGVFDPAAGYQVRRWDQKPGSGHLLKVATTGIDLENGIKVAFSSGQYQPGDYWCIRSNAAAGSIIWPPASSGQGGLVATNGFMPTFSWGRRRVPLAIYKSGTDGFELVDVRSRFPALTGLAAEDVAFDDTKCRIEADTVQLALEKLCERQSGNIHCDHAPASAKDLEALAASLLPRAVDTGGTVIIRDGIIPGTVTVRPEAGPTLTDLHVDTGLSGFAGDGDDRGLLVGRPGLTLDPAVVDLTGLTRTDLDLAVVFKELRSATICLRRGLYFLSRPLLFKDMDTITIRGSGKNTILRVAKDQETVLRFENCRNVRLENLCVQSTYVSKPSEASRPRRATIDVEAVNTAWLENLHVETGDGQSHSVSAVSIDAGASADVTVRDCEILPGLGQSGLEVLSPRRATIENNRVGPPARKKQVIMDNLLRDDVFLRDRLREIIKFPPKTGPITDPVTDPVDILASPAIDPRETIASSGSPILAPGALQIKLGGTDFGVVAGKEAVFEKFGLLAEAELLEMDTERKYEFMLEKFTEAVRSDRGVVVIGDREFDGFVDIKKDIFTRAKELAHEGIVVGSTRIGDVTIRQNEVFNCLTNIRVAETPKPKNNEEFDWISVPAESISRRVVIENNTLSQNRPSELSESTGISLGHFDTAIIRSNDISAAREDDDIGKVTGGGIWAFCRRGRHMLIEGNSVFGYPVSAFVYPDAPTSSLSRPNWFFAFNSVSGGLHLASDIHKTP